MESAHQIKWVYEELGVDLSGLGCIMIRVTPPEINLPEWYEYYSNDPKKFWIKGVVSDNAHVTLKYGLFPEVKRTHVDAMLEGWELTDIYKKEVIVFDSPYEDEKYKCIVLSMESASLKEANARLTMLPNINTFKEYVPHLTLAYVCEDFVDEAVSRIKSQIQSYHPQLLGIDYGDLIK